METISWRNSRLFLGSFAMNVCITSCLMITQEVQTDMTVHQTSCSKTASMDHCSRPQQSDNQTGLEWRFHDQPPVILPVGISKTGSVHGLPCWPGADSLFKSHQLVVLRSSLFPIVKLSHRLINQVLLMSGLRSLSGFIQSTVRGENYTFLYHQ